MKKCKDCKEYACIRRSENSNCFFEEMYDYVEKEEKELYLEHFRAEAAKDILCHLLDRYTGDSDNKGFVTQAIGIADELIKQLKEKEEK